MLISIVIPCRNEVNTISECVHNIFNSKIDSSDSLEVIIVDGISTDGTIEIINDLIIKFPSLKLIHNKKQITPIAFNLGIKAAKGDFIQIIGVRQIISNNYLKDAKNTLLENNKIWCVGGKVENIYSNDKSKIIGKAMSSSFGVGGSNFRVFSESGYTDTVGTPMYNKIVFESIGYFNEDLVRNQDDEFSYRIIQAGGKIFLNNAISIKYYVRANYKNLYKQYYQYGFWKVFVNVKHKTVTTIRQLIPLFFVLFLIIGGGLSFLHSIFAWLFLIVLGLYLALNLLSAYKVSENIKETFLISYTFLILHISYGLGYLNGIINFILLKRKPNSKNTALTR